MLLTEETLLAALEERLASADAVDLAVAWAGPGKAFTKIIEFARRSPGRLRAIVGIAGNATYPRVLHDLHRDAALRIPNSSPLFHPKLYLFRKGSQAAAWVGSANLTRCGFEQNAELVSVVVDDGSYAGWFNDWWKSLDEDPSETIKRYSAAWKPPSRPGEREGTDAGRVAGPVAEHEFRRLLGSVSDWKSFVEALRIASAYWRGWYGVSVDGEDQSWLNTITLGNEIVRRRSWSDLSKNDYRLLMGIEVDVDGVSAGYGLLGSMKGAGDAKNVFNEASAENLRIREQIRAALQPAIEADVSSFREAALDFIRVVEGFQGFSGAVATRLLALARPDIAVSVNKGSRDSLAAWSGLPKSALSKSGSGKRGASYGSLLDFLAEQEWYSSPAPKGTYEKGLADARAALLDCLVYKA
jgi:hypothetical protein